MQRHLIITADDFGLHRTVNEAVEQASRRGILTAASLMVTGAAAADAVQRARRLPNLRVGLHIVLADGWAALPQDQIPAIADVQGRMGDDMFFRAVRFFSSAAARRQLEAEIGAQFAAFARTGLHLDHVNVHKHFHLHPTILGALIRIARDFGARAVRVPREPFWFAARSPNKAAALAGVLLRPSLLLMKHRLRAAGIFHNDTVFGVAPSGAMDEPRLLAILGRLPRGVTEIYLHPATTSGRAVNSSMRGYRHADELAALLSPTVHNAVAKLNIRCGGYGDILLDIGRSLA